MISLTLIACEPDAPKFPNVQVFETARDPQSGDYLCGEYVLADVKNIKFKPVVDHPIFMCEGVFGFKTKDFPRVVDWMRATEKYYKEKCEDK